MQMLNDEYHCCRGRYGTQRMSNCGPLSLTSSMGRPNREKTSLRVEMSLLDVVEDIRKTSGYLLWASTIGVAHLLSIIGPAKSI